ncbi:MAG TPA: hypothetical protein VK435_00595 [Thermodesulfovibrionales bacterium]|nr:hypothetical protein [Thermodesulfovibrionales bacterium]
MKINFTKDQYENLIKLVYLGNWVINSYRTDNTVDKYDELEQYIFSFFEDFKMDKYIEHDRSVNQYFPTREFEEDTDVEEYRDEYDNYTFWDELVYRLARRDLIRKYGEATVLAMAPDDLMSKEEEFVEKYEVEFEVNGVENLEIRDLSSVMLFEVKGNA